MSQNTSVMLLSQRFSWAQSIISVGIRFTLTKPKEIERLNETNACHDNLASWHETNAWNHMKFAFLIEIERWACEFGRRVKITLNKNLQI